MSQAALFEPERTFGVGELVARIGRAMAAAFPAEVWVRGEVHGLKAANANGHVYFDLCERNNRRGPTSTLPAALFRADRQRVERSLAEWPDFRLADGLEVRVQGRVGYAFGRVQLVVSTIDPVHTLGQLAAERQRVLRALAADGLLGANRAVPFPALPLRVGLVTSVGSAAYEDVVHELTQAGFGFRLVVADARVQGAGAELSIVRALSALADAACDVVLLVRGGGSRTDLVAFDGERLARAVARMPVPVLTGVGHEIDTCVVDEVAHSSYKTPTACAAAVVERVQHAVASTESAWQAVVTTASRCLARAEQGLDTAGHRISPTRLDAALTTAARSLDGHAQRVGRAAVVALDRRLAHVDLLAAQAAAADPSALLARGWSLTRTADGRLVRCPDDAPPGTELHTTLAAGTVRSEVLHDERR